MLGLVVQVSSKGQMSLWVMLSCCLPLASSGKECQIVLHSSEPASSSLVPESSS